MGGERGRERIRVFVPLTLFIHTLYLCQVQEWNALTCHYVLVDNMYFVM